MPGYLHLLQREVVFRLKFFVATQHCTSLYLDRPRNKRVALPFLRNHGKREDYPEIDKDPSE
jgi:hypothetical protein